MEKERIKNKIKVLYSKEDNISAICSRFLYIRYLLNKGYIPIETLKDTASMMTTQQYDEDEMEKLIKSLRYMILFLHYCTSCTRKRVSRKALCRYKVQTTDYQKQY